MNLQLIRSRLFTFFQRMVFGVLLGLVLSLFFILLVFKLSYFQYLVIACLVGWVLYFGLPLLAGLLTTYRPIFAEEATGKNVGLEVGAICFIVNILAVLVIFIIVSTYTSGRLLPLIETMIFLVFLFFHIVGLFLAALGGSLGRAIRKRRIQPQ